MRLMEFLKAQGPKAACLAGEQEGGVPLMIAVMLVCLVALPASASAYYLDVARGDDGNPGTSAEKAWRTLDKANAALVSGDTCLLRAGVYADSQIAPARSGAPGAPITYAAYPGESPEITGGKSGSIVNLEQRSYVVVRGLKIHSPTEHDWVVRISGEQAQRNRVERCDITDPEGYAPVVIAEKACYNTIVECTVHDTGHGEEGSGDCIVLNEGAHHNTVTRSKCYNGCHSQIMAINGSSHNVIADNEMYATNRAWAGAGVNLGLDSSSNLVVGNRIHDLGYITDQKCAIQVGTAHNLLQNNVVYNVGAFGISLQSYPYDGHRQEAVGNLVANNTVANCGRQPLLILSKVDCISRDNRIASNIVVGSPRDWYDIHAWVMVFDTYHLTQPAAPGRWFGNVFENNVLFHSRPGEPGMVLYSHKGGTATWSVPELETEFGESYRGNIEADPQFTDPLRGDFRLKPNSPIAGGGIGAAMGHRGSDR